MRALVFGGQGSLKSGLGRDFYDAYPEVRQHYDATPLKKEVASFVFDSTENLNEHLFSQLGLIQFYMSAYDCLKKRYDSFDLTFGLSLGTYGSLYATEALSGERLFDLVDKRSRYMYEVARNSDSQLMAILGMSIDEVSDVLSELNQSTNRLFIANDNAIGQIVVGGDEKSISNLKVSLEKKKKRSILLSVSAAFHTPFMEEARMKYKEAMSTFQFDKFKIPVVDNRTAALMDEKGIEDTLSYHLVNLVRFRESLFFAQSFGIKEYVVIDSGKTIESFIKKTLGKDTNIVVIDSVEAFKNLGAC